MKSTVIKTISIISIILICAILLASIIILCLPSPKIIGCQNFSYTMGKPLPEFIKNIFAEDFKGRDLTNNIKIDDSEVNWAKSGEYPLYFIVSDKFNKKTIEKVLVKVTETIPYFNGLRNHFIELGNENYNFLNNVHAYDAFNNNLDKQIIVDDSNINYKKTGEYDLYYIVTDKFNLTQKEKVTVYIKDTEFFKPYFVIDNKKIEYTIGTNNFNFTKYIKAYNYNNQEISDLINFDYSNINFNETGEYELGISVLDYENNFNEDVVEIQVVNIDEEKYPIIKGIQDYSLIIGEPLPDWSMGVTATDSVDGDITDKIEIITDNIDFNNAGEYKIYYKVKNSRGYSYIIFSKVKIHLHGIDITQPKIIGAKDLEYVFGKGEDFNYLDGVTAVDDIDGDITDKIIFDDSNVNYQKLGTYKAFYKVKDNSGNQTIVEIRLKVVDKTYPKIYNTESTINYYIGDEIPDYITNITARDDYDGDITDKILVDDKMVNYNKEGEYIVSYIVEDSSGNKTTVNINVNIINRN